MIRAEIMFDDNGVHQVDRGDLLARAATSGTTINETVYN